MATANREFLRGWLDDLANSYISTLKGSAQRAMILDCQNVLPEIWSIIDGEREVEADKNPRVTGPVEPNLHSDEGALPIL